MKVPANDRQGVGVNSILLEAVVDYYGKILMKLAACGTALVFAGGITLV